MRTISFAILLMTSNISGAADIPEGLSGFGAKATDALTIVVEADCGPCIRAYTEITSRMALHDPGLKATPIRWIPVGKDGNAQLAAGRALEKGDIDGFNAPIREVPNEESLKQARANAEILRRAKVRGYPLFFKPNGDARTGYQGWEDFVSWLSR